MSVMVELASNSCRRHNPPTQTTSTMTSIAVRSENLERVQTRPAAMTLPRQIRQTMFASQRGVQFLADSRSDHGPLRTAIVRLV